MRLSSRGLRWRLGIHVSFLEAIRDPEYPEHEEMLEWIGGEFDPEAFDLEEVNVELSSPLDRGNCPFMVP